MGNYNPHAPNIIGQEWVPIRDQDLVFSPSVNSIEVGTTYVQTAPQRIRDARFYVHELVAPPTFYQVGLVNLYPTGQEDNTGPIQQAIIPCSAATVSGGNISLINAADYPTAFYQPGDSKYARLIYNSGTIQLIDLFFGVNSFPQLNGKRILNVSLLYAGTVTDRDVNGVPINFVNPTASVQTMSLVSQYNTSNVGQSFSAKTFITNTGTLDLVSNVDAIGSSGFALQQVRELDLGDINNCWDPTNLATAIKMPWRYPDLARFESGATNGQKLQVQFVIPLTNNNAGGNDVVVTLEYFALRVMYCEETRVAYGAQQFQYAYGMNSIAIRDTSLNADPVIAAGTYTPTLSWVSMGQVGFGQGITGEFPKLNASRQLYSIPSHIGKQINVPFPLDARVGVPFTSQTIDVLPQISLHVSGGTMTEPHVYGRQAAAQVYGTITATQEILDSAAGSATTWPQVRYYARRFGDTTVSLLLDSPTITGAGRSVTLTPAEWDALPELIDGWKEITKRFTSPPTMGSGTSPQWRWSATGELAGNRWEVLGAIAPAISGVPGSFYTQVPTAHRLSTATYGAPSVGSTINLGWVPGYAPPVTATTDDASADAVLIFSVDPPTITGFTVTPSSQAVTGFTECTRGPCCIPTAIAYNRITWSMQTALPVTGFGAYELQRLDPVDTTWQTIMLATSPTVTGFSDYEARVGLTSSYQIRTRNALSFNGAWSVTGTGAIAEPGVTMPSCGTSKRGVLIFTSNEVQTGLSNLAYAMTWEDAVSEDFSFPEADTIQVQRHHDRDFQVAFHGSERGGEQFSRRLLIANAAVPLPRLANMDSLRDLAWRDLTYVCVRDDIGDRWLATVVVPQGSVRRKRRLYNADITVIEVTATPSQVNPS